MHCWAAASKARVLDFVREVVVSGEWMEEKMVWRTGLRVLEVDGQVQEPAA